MRSRTAPMTSPSVKVMDAGPSHGSIIEAWNSKNPRLSSLMVSWPLHGSGIIIMTECGRDRPVCTRNSSA